MAESRLPEKTRTRTVRENRNMTGKALPRRNQNSSIPNPTSHSQEERPFTRNHFNYNQDFEKVPTTAGQFRVVFNPVCIYCRSVTTPSYSRDLMYSSVRSKWRLGPSRLGLGSSSLVWRLEWMSSISPLRYLVVTVSFCWSK